MPYYDVRLENGEIAVISAATPEQALAFAARTFLSDPDVIENEREWPEVDEEYYDVNENSIFAENNTFAEQWEAYKKENGLYPYATCDDSIDTSEKPLKLSGAKYDGGKYTPSLCKIEPLVRAIAATRKYGLEKYAEAEDWESIDTQRWREALVRHVLAENDDPGGYDAESGLPHMFHIATNVMFILAHYQV